MAQLHEGVSLSLPAPDVSFFSDASDVGWGALVGEHHASGLWSPHQKTFSINLRELLAVQYGLKTLEHLLVGLSVALFCDNTTTVAYLRRFGRNVLFHSERHSKGGTPLGGESPCPSPATIHHGVVQCHSGRSKSPPIR